MILCIVTVTMSMSCIYNKNMRAVCFVCAKSQSMQNDCNRYLLLNSKQEVVSFFL